MALTAKQQKFADEYLIDVERFWYRVDMTMGEDNCWTWTGATDRQGYGRFRTGRTRNSSMLAHRVAYGLTTGTNPEAVCHFCDNPSCCNPKHLFGGTRADNNRDMTRKRRHAAHIGTQNHVQGTRHPGAKLKEELIPEIRRTYQSGFHSQRALARRYGVSQRTIAKVVNEVGWTHV